MCRTAALFLFIAFPAIAQLTRADPLFYANTTDRFHAYIFRTYTDPTRLSWMLIESATDHWARAPHQWDQSPESYSFRVASAWGRRIVANTTQFGFETILHEDSRYRPSGKRQFVPRILFAVKHSVLAYKPDGSVEPMYGRIAAGMVTAATSSTWQPQSVNAVSLLSGIGEGAIDRAEGNLLTEFEPDLINFGRKTWSVLRGK
jgi:hypothetical protein